MKYGIVRNLHFGFFVSYTISSKLRLVCSLRFSYHSAWAFFIMISIIEWFTYYFQPATCLFLCYHSVTVEPYIYITNNLTVSLRSSDSEWVEPLHCYMKSRKDHVVQLHLSLNSYYVFPDISALKHYKLFLPT